jgi:hypothetical protein
MGVLLKQGLINISLIDDLLSDRIARAYGSIMLIRKRIASAGV